MTFSPKEDYIITQEPIRISDFRDYSDAFVTRPPYQRKTVWSNKKKQALMDSLLRRYYIPRLVLRKIRLTDSKTIDEVIDGQQRINTLQDFYDNKFSLPKTLKDLGLSGKYYNQLDVEIRQYIDKLHMQADRILSIEKKDDPDNQRVATEIFWRLQQGESLNSMEIVHARLASRTRNFLVKYADDITFDYEKYLPVDSNPNKHSFFRIIKRGNQRMEHLALLGRMLLLEQNDGYADLKDISIKELIEQEQTEDGIGDDSFEDDVCAKTVLKNLTLFHSLFDHDPMLKNGGKISELSREYFILSFYVLVSHLRKYYVTDDVFKINLHKFFIKFYSRWRDNDVDDTDIIRFRESRQQGEKDIRERDIILRHSFFKYLNSKKNKKKHELKAKDSNRNFNEYQRIFIYRRDKGFCQFCKQEGKPDKEALVSWEDYQADHIIAWIKGGETGIENGQLLCSYHNQSKGSKL